jgi:exodeoxyribonuclease VII large subunit
MAGTRVHRARDASSSEVQELRFDFSAFDEVGEELSGASNDQGAQEPLERGEAQGAANFSLVSGLSEASPELDTGPLFAPGTASQAALSVGDFYARVRGALRDAFPEEIWVTGEICKVTTSRGHRYLELSDHLDPTAAPQSDGGGSSRFAPAARSQAATLEVACWARDWPVVQYELQAVGVELVPGLVVRVRGKVSVWEGGSKLRFTMTALDVEALVGGIAAARRRLLGALAAENLLEANRRLSLALVPLRVGLVTSPGSEAYRDFTGQLERSGYRFEVRFEPSTVQGPEAPGQIVAALARLGEFEPQLVVIVRGGGAKGDLAAFDSELVARAIAAARFPVWTGIGHTGDRSVADEVAHQALVTPTQCGEALVAVVASYLEGVDRRARLLAQRVQARLELANRELAGCSASLTRCARQGLERSALKLSAAESHIANAALVTIERSRGRLQNRAQRLSRPAGQHLVAQAQLLAHKRELLQVLDPSHQLQRGWSLTRGADGRLVRSAGELRRGEKLVTSFAEGSAVSVIDEVRLGSGDDQVRQGAPRKKTHGGDP